MGKRENVLKSYLENTLGRGDFKRPNYVDFKNSRFHPFIMKVYRDLGGKKNDYPINFRGFDIKLKDVIVELDEERHFNRYRYETLNSPVYDNWKGFSVRKYKKWCNEYEENCLQSAHWGNSWQNKNSNEHFNISAKLSENKFSDASRWKQRAFFDYLRDVSSILMNVKLIRLSIYQRINYSSVTDLIKNHNLDVISEYIQTY